MYRRYLWRYHELAKYQLLVVCLYMTELNGRDDLQNICVIYVRRQIQKRYNKYRNVILCDTSSKIAVKTRLQYM
jgi:hypothetical protein